MATTDPECASESVENVNNVTPEKNSESNSNNADEESSTSETNSSLQDNFSKTEVAGAPEVEEKITNSNNELNERQDSESNSTQSKSLLDRLTNFEEWVSGDATNSNSDNFQNDGADSQNAAISSRKSIKKNFVFLKSYAFNQNASGFICTTTKGIRVYTCEPLFEFTKHEYPDWKIGPCVVGQMLYKTNCFIVVSEDEKKKVKIWNDQSKKVVGEIRSRTDVLQVCIARCILAMITEYAIYVYKCECMSALQVIKTGRNSFGLCSIANIDTKSEWKIACPANVTGAVRIQTSEGGRSNHVFTAHKSPLFNLAFNYDGSMIATASTKGTVVRVFSVYEGNLLYEFRRGTPSSMISCIAFRRDDMFLATASSAPTVHIFKLCSTKKSNNVNNSPHLFSEIRNNLNTSADQNNQGHATISNTNEVANKTDDTTTTEEEDTRKGSSIEVCSESGRKEFLFDEPNASSGIASAIYDTSVGVFQDTLKGVLPKYFKPGRSFAQFYIPKDNLTIDVTDSSSNIIGPLCAFVHRDSTHLYLLHLNGIFYEFRFDPIKGGDCEIIVATTWFSPRADFHIQSHHGCETVPSTLEGGHEGDEWQVL